MSSRYINSSRVTRLVYNCIFTRNVYICNYVYMYVYARVCVLTVTDYLLILHLLFHYSSVSAPSSFPRLSKTYIILEWFHKKAKHWAIMFLMIGMQLLNGLQLYICIIWVLLRLWLLSNKIFYGNIIHKFSDFILLKCYFYYYYSCLELKSLISDSIKTTDQW